MTTIDHAQTLSGLRSHLNQHSWVGLTSDPGVFANSTSHDQSDKWNDYEVDLLAQVLASAPQHVRAGLASMLAVPRLVYPHIDPDDTEA